MRSRKPTAPPPTPARPAPATGPASEAPRSHRFRLLLVLVLLGAAGWGAWSLLRSDPLRAVQAALDRRDFRTADQLLEQRLAEDPNDGAARLLAARSARRAGDFARAFDHLQKYRQQTGGDAASDLESTLLRIQSGNLTDADRLFAEYAAKPDSPEMPLVMEAYLEGKLKVLAPRSDAQIATETTEAAGVANLRRAVELWLGARPGRADQAQGRVWHARVFVLANDQLAAAAALREALELDPEHFDARFHLAMTVAQSNPEEACRNLEILQKRYPQNYFVRFGLASTYRMLGRLKEARPILEDLLVANPQDASALIELGQLALDEGKLTEAEPLLRRALALAPKAPLANLAMSRCQALAGRPDESAKYRKRFEELEASKKKGLPASVISP